ncbi:Uncharacterised protein [Klebsiella pneumoniae]|uniref:Uncharacterized protein n=1 Tax=Klebsiella pneumoniae TaxID=573 RepID=A0A377XGT8_KLEPN|nr:Uncharacterised protein [Klebsiella pneumoniae]
MATNIQGNMKYKGRLNLLPSANAPYLRVQIFSRILQAGVTSLNMPAGMFYGHPS